MRVSLPAVAMLCSMAATANAAPASSIAGDGIDEVGVTLAEGDADPPWLEHAMDDLGGNPTGWKRSWCARSINIWLHKSGLHGCGGDSAISCLEAGKRLPEPEVGALAVMPHHVGIVTDVDEGSVVLISGNHNRKVAISSYAKRRIIGYVWPE